MGAKECLSAQSLGGYAAGTISVVEAETIIAHLNECGRCMARLDELSRESDPLLDALRGVAAAQPPSPELVAAVAAVVAGKIVRDSQLEAPSAAGTLIGGYRILQELGRGGMGRVYRAVHPRLDQEVALKVLRPGMDSAPILARFEAERQALALMDHPHIARVSDGGVTENGQPFFVMELVRGVPITRYCEQHSLGLRRRLELFTDVCQAVQHAHQKGVIHRDLKPSNILVAEYDGRATPKVIDFGVARAIERGSDAETEIGMLVGTPEYMSPEQASLSSRDMDTRSDIYALGVLLYELLTGDTPIARQRVRSLPVFELLRLIREEDPPAPSIRVSQIPHGRTIPHSAIRNPQWKELDWITLKTLDKDRGRRYETAAGLADDVRRFLNDEMVLASPPSNAYRLRKVMRRHRRLLTTVAAFVLLMVAGVVVTTWLALEAREAQAAAEIDRDTAVVAGQRANDSAKEARSVLTFFQERIMAVGRPEGLDGGLGSEVTIRQAVDAAEPHIAESFREQPLVEASVRHSLGMTYIYVGDPAAAIVQLERAGKLRQDKLGAEHADTLAAMHDLGVACDRAGDIVRAESLLEEVVRLRQNQLGADHPDTLKSMSELAGAYEATGKLDQAVDLGRRTVDGLTAQLGPDHLDTLYATAQLSGIERFAGKFKESTVLAERALEGMKARLGEEHPNTLSAMNVLGLAYHSAGDYERAMSLLNGALEIQKRKLGKNHLQTLSTMHNIAMVYGERRQFDKAIPLLVQVLEGRNSKLPPDHPSTLNCMNNLAYAYQHTGRASEALPLMQKVFDASQAKLGPDHSKTFLVMHDLAALHFFAGNVDRAIALHEEARERRLAKLGPDHPDTLNSMHNLAYCYWKANKTELAIPLLEQVIKSRNTALGPDHPLTIGSVTTLGVVYREAGKFESALSLLDEAWTEKQQRLGPTHPITVQLLKDVIPHRAQLGYQRLLEKRFVEAEELLRQTLKAREQFPDVWQTFWTRSLLGKALVEQKKYAEAEPLLLSGYEGMKQNEATIPEKFKSHLPESIQHVVQLYEAWDKTDEAAKWSKLLPAKTDSTPSP